MKFDWTDEALKVLKERTEDGFSAAEIGRALGCGRNAVIGKLHRLRTVVPLKPHARCLKNRAPETALKPIMESRKLRQPRVVLTEDQKHQMVCAAAPDDAIALVDLHSGECRWPFGDPRKLDEFRFCGHRIAFGSYCAAHASASVRRCA